MVVAGRKIGIEARGFEDEKNHTPTAFASTNICVGDKGLFPGATA